MSGLKLAFAGTPELAAVVLDALIQHPEHQVERILTQPDRPSGRGKKIRPGPVKELALRHQLDIEQAESSAEIDAISCLDQFDALIVVAYGCLLKPVVFNRPRLGTLNIHTSLLPRWRGAAPIQRAIQAGDKKTGVTIMQIDEGMDTGPILLQRDCMISPYDTSGSLHDKLAKLGAETLIEALDLITSGKITPRAQDESLACHAAKISKQEASIDWSKSAEELNRMIRAFNPAPVAFCRLADIDMRIWETKVISTNAITENAGAIIKADKTGITVACGADALCITSLQLPGKKTMSGEQFLNGHPDFAKN